MGDIVGINPYKKGTFPGIGKIEKKTAFTWERSSPRYIILNYTLFKIHTQSFFFYVLKQFI